MARAGACPTRSSCTSSGQPPVRRLRASPTSTPRAGTSGCRMSPRARHSSTSARASPWAARRAGTTKWANSTTWPTSSARRRRRRARTCSSCCASGTGSGTGWGCATTASGACRASRTTWAGYCGWTTRRAAGGWWRSTSCRPRRANSWACWRPTVTTRAASSRKCRTARARPCGASPTPKA